MWQVQVREYLRSKAPVKAAVLLTLSPVIAEMNDTAIAIPAGTFG